MGVNFDFSTDVKHGYRFTCECGFRGPVHGRTDTDLLAGSKAAHVDEARHHRTCKPRLPDVIDDLVFPPPDCSVCDGSLDFDDGWWCPRCCIGWDTNGRGGLVDDDARDDGLEGEGS